MPSFHDLNGLHAILADMFAGNSAKAHEMFVIRKEAVTYCSPESTECKPSFVDKCLYVQEMNISFIGSRRFCSSTSLYIQCNPCERSAFIATKVQRYHAKLHSMHSHAVSRHLHKDIEYIYMYSRRVERRFATVT